MFQLAWILYYDAVLQNPLFFFFFFPFSKVRGCDKAKLGEDIFHLIPFGSIDMLSYLSFSLEISYLVPFEHVPSLTI